jgi:leucyl/phenylalanyl-tRNA---protein transferase
MDYRILSKRIEFPHPSSADEDGLLAIGGDLSPDRLIAAYKNGIFPWYSEGQPILWFSPDPRMVLYPKDFKRSKSLDRVLRSGRFEIRIDTNFESVIRACAATPRRNQDGTWITEDMIQAYIKLHRLGIAHCFEAYRANELVGGLYGLSLGAAFFGESMFHDNPDASKFAFAHLVAFALQKNFRFIDAQTPSDHLQSLGAEELDRKAFLLQLGQALESDSLIGPWNLLPQ